MNDEDYGLALFATIGLITFVWGAAWLGYKIEQSWMQHKYKTASKSGSELNESPGSLSIGNSIGAFIAGIIAIVIAIIIRSSY